jgi:hypothetical protein
MMVKIVIKSSKLKAKSRALGCRMFRKETESLPKIMLSPCPLSWIKQLKHEKEFI